jgi:cytochrome c oxidase cbb3-type subunit I/II
VLTLATVAHFEIRQYTWKSWHEELLHHAFPFSVLSLIAVAIGGALQIIPTVALYKGDGDARLLEGRVQRPYRPWNWPAATSTSAKAATTAIRR